MSVIKPGFTSRRVRCQSVSSFNHTSLPTLQLVKPGWVNWVCKDRCDGLLIAVLGTRSLFPKCFGSSSGIECDSVFVCVCVRERERQRERQREDRTHMGVSLLS